MAFVGRKETEQYVRTMYASRRLGKWLKSAIEEGQGMSILGKLQHVTEATADLNKEAELTLDGIAEKIVLAKKRLAEVELRHHAHYDGIIKGAEASIEVIDRLSNVPLDGKESDGHKLQGEIAEGQSGRGSAEKP